MSLLNRIWSRRSTKLVAVFGIGSALVAFPLWEVLDYSGELRGLISKYIRDADSKVAVIQEIESIRDFLKRLLSFQI